MCWVGFRGGADDRGELDSRFQAKYAVDTGLPYWCLEPSKVLAWNGGLLDTMTRWSF